MSGDVNAKKARSELDHATRMVVWHADQVLSRSAKLLEQAEHLTNSIKDLKASQRTLLDLVDPQGRPVETGG